MKNTANTLATTHHTLSAFRTADGLIEITSLEMLDALVGGLIEPEQAYCELTPAENTKAHSDSQGVI
ncbi:hypothetical protein [Pseudoalteromonas xiamenensis]